MSSDAPPVLAYASQACHNVVLDCGQQPTFFMFAGDHCDCPSGSGAFILLVHAATLLQKAGQGVEAGC